jgi:hypothetical protein
MTNAAQRKSRYPLYRLIPELVAGVGILIASHFTNANSSTQQKNGAWAETVATSNFLFNQGQKAEQKGNMRQAGLAYLASCNYTQHTISSIESKTRLKFLAQEHEVVFNLLTSPAGKHAGARVFAEIKDDFRYDYRYPDSARSAMIEMDIAVEGDVPAPTRTSAPGPRAGA